MTPEASIHAVVSQRWHDTKTTAVPSVRTMSTRVSSRAPHAVHSRVPGAAGTGELNEPRGWTGLTPRRRGDGDDTSALAPQDPQMPLAADLADLDGGGLGEVTAP